jgi:hypothetical protein
MERVLPKKRRPREGVAVDPLSTARFHTSPGAARHIVSQPNGAGQPWKRTAELLGT